MSNHSFGYLECLNHKDVLVKASLRTSVAIMFCYVKIRNLGVPFLTRCLIALCFHLLNSRYIKKISIFFAHPSLYPFLPILSLSLSCLLELSQNYNPLKCVTRRNGIRDENLSRFSIFKRKEQRKKIWSRTSSLLLTTSISLQRRFSFSLQASRYSSFLFLLPLLTLFLSLSRLLHYEINLRIRLSRTCCNSLPLSPTSTNLHIMTLFR